MGKPIRFADLPAQLAPLTPEIVRRFAELVRDGRFIGGDEVAHFERDFACLCGVEHCVGVASGTDALILALRALGIGPGDVVLVPAHTFIATASAVTFAGATPRFVDIDPLTFTLDPAALAAADLRGVAAIIPVHLYGQPADLGPILDFARAHKLVVIEDAAQAHGATYQGAPVGSFGDLAAFSFYPGKNLGALGDGGAVVGRDPELVGRVRRLADHGRRSKNDYAEPGCTSRLDAIQAMALNVKMPHLGDWNRQRARVAEWYDERLAGCDGVITPRAAAERSHVYHLYVIRVPDRDGLAAALTAANIQCGVHYPLALHQTPAYAGSWSGVAFPVAEQVASSCLSLPVYPELTAAEVDRIAEVVCARVGGGR